MIVERRRKYLGRRLRSKVKEGRPARERSALAETPHETNLRIALYAARIDAVVIGRGAIAVEAEMDGILLSDGDLPVGERYRRPQQKRTEPPEVGGQAHALPIGFDRISGWLCRYGQSRYGQSRSSSRHVHPRDLHCQPRFMLGLKDRIFSGIIAAGWIATRNSLQVLYRGNYRLQLLIVPSCQRGRCL
jgi:hypothetical protein